jgi:post-segregation antitoxin (ccd killing protein)
MGRKPIDKGEKKVPLSVSIKQKYVEELRKRNVNVSQIIEEFVKNYLKKDEN